MADSTASPLSPALNRAPSSAASYTRVAARRDRLCFNLAVAAAILTLLGAAGESIGLDRRLRANTVTRRTHSLFRQGREYLRMLIADGSHLFQLLRVFQRLIRRQPLTCTTYALI